MLKLGHVLFGRSFLGERPRQHELGLEYGSAVLHDSVKCRRHPGNGRMLSVALDVSDAAAGVALVPGAVEFLGGGPKLDDEVAGKVLWLRLASLLSPQADQGSFVAAHDDPCIRAANEAAPADGIS